MRPFRHFAANHWPGLLLLAMSVCIGLCCYQHYGVGWDEPIQRGMGMVSYNYVFNHSNDLLTFNERSHGVAFELPLIILEKQLHLTDTRGLYLMRHLVTHLFFLFAVFCGYLLCMRLFRDQFTACLGFVLLAFHPRVYAHSFINSKDIPFLSALLILFLAAQLAFSKDRSEWYLLSAVTCAYATAIRAMGIMFAAIVVLFLLIDLIRAVKSKQAGKAFIHFTVFTLAFCGCLCALWPILWTQPFFHFREEFLALSHIYWSGFVLLNGTTYAGDQLPWFYAPEWMAITTPILWLVAGIAGCAAVIIGFFRSPSIYLSNTNQRHFLFYFIAFLLPLAAVVALHSILYDDWRHLYFIYPSFVLLALFAIHKVASGRYRKLVMVACAIQVCAISFFMICNHPFEQLYFNRLVSHQPEFLRTHFDLDYWGCGDKQGLEYILAHDKSDTIRIWRSLDPVTNNLKIIPANERGRILLVDSADRPTYFITNFRNHPADYSYHNIFFEKKVLNSTVVAVYKLP